MTKLEDSSVKDRDQLRLNQNAVPEESVEKSVCCFLASDVLWHFRLNHVAESRLKSLTDVIPNLTLSTKDLKQKCDGCLFGKLHRDPIQSNKLSYDMFEKLVIEAYAKQGISHTNLNVV